MVNFSLAGGSKASRRQTTRSEELELVRKEDREAAEELDYYMDPRWEEDEPLNSPFAVRANPTPEELKEMREMAWFYDPATYNY